LKIKLSEFIKPSGTCSRPGGYQKIITILLENQKRREKFGKRGIDGRIILNQHDTGPSEGLLQTRQTFGFHK
jgi:hypothetical protein